MIVLTLDNITTGEIIKRPSATCKTPYVADVLLEDNVTTLGHTPALGCCGLSDKGSQVILSKISNNKTKCSHKVEIAKYIEDNKIIYVGINPKLAENIAESCLKNNCLSFLQNCVSFRREVTYLNSRFDFSGIDSDGKTFYMEIKNVPLADYVDCVKKERKNHIEYINNCDINDKISYFPDGYRKNKNQVVSPRALKHIEELEQIVLTTEYRAILCFVIQRNDVKQFQPSNLDLTYKQAVQKAYLNGVEIRTIQVEWNNKGEAMFIYKPLPIILFDIHGPFQT